MSNDASLQQIRDSLWNEYPWTQFITTAEFEELVWKIYDAEHRGDDE